MANRTVAVTLSAQVAGYVAGMEQARKSTGKVSEEAKEAKKKLDEQGRAFSELGGFALKMGAVAAVGIGLAVAKFAEFDKAMSQVKAATQESAENMTLLREAALDAGAATAFSATEAANAIEELGKAGLTTQEILTGGLDGALTLAAAGGIGVAEAAGYAAMTMKQFNLEGSETTHVADLLAAGAGKAVGDVSDLAQALGQAGLIAQGAGYSVEDTTGSLAAFADNALIGSDAGTSFKAAIVAMQAPVPKTQKLLDELGISFYNTNGEMKSTPEIAGMLQEKLGDLTAETRNAALAQIYGTDALRVANILYKEGADGMQGYIDQTNDSGYAAKVAADRMNNLAGDVEKLGGSFDTALIRTGSGANEVLRGLVQSATFLVDGFGSLPTPVLNAALAIGSAATAVLLVNGAVATGGPKWAAFKANVDASGLSMGRFALRSAVMSGAIGLATIAVGFFVAQQAEAAATTAELKESLDKATGSATKYTREIIAKKLAESGAFDAAEAAGVSQRDLTSAILEGGDALETVNNKIKGANTLGNFFNFTESGAVAAGNATMKIKELSDGVVQAGENLEDEAAAADNSAESSEGAAEAYATAAAEAQGLTDNLTSLIDTVNEANGVGQDAVTTNANYQSALADVIDYVAQAKAGVEGYTLGWAANTVEGSANRAMLSGLAADSQSAAAAQLALDGNTEAYMATMVAGNKLMYDQARAFGASEEEAREFADSVYAIPTQHETDLLVDSAAASSKIAQFVRDLRNIPGRRDVVINQVVTQTGAARGEVAAAYATGGAVVGPGGPTSDEAGLFRLSNGEHVLDSEDVRRMGGQAGVYKFRESLYGGMANGGAVQYSSSGGGSSSVNVSPQVSLAGATLLMSVDGRQMTAVIQEQIVAVDQTNESALRRGRQVR